MQDHGVSTKLDFLTGPLSKLTRTPSVYSIATAAVTERVNSCPWMRELGTTQLESDTVKHFIVHPTSQPRDTRSIDDRCILVMDFAMCVKALTPSQLSSLGSTLLQMATPMNDDNERPIASSVYECLTSISGMLDALRTGVGEEIACIMGGVAAVHAFASGKGTSASKTVYELITRRVRNSGRLLHASKIEKPVWAVLLDPHADLDNRLGVRPESSTEERVKVVVAVAVGTNLPVFDDKCPTRVLQTPHCLHVRFQRAMKMLTHSKGSWSLADALIPCNSVPIRTEQYVAYVTAVLNYTNCLIDSLTALERSEYATSPEQKCAWGMMALCNPEVQSPDIFYSSLKSWCGFRAHQPPDTGTADWLSARALLSQCDLDVQKLCSEIHGALARQGHTDARKQDVFGRIASLCVSTRTLSGLKLLAADPYIAKGMMHCVTYLENGSFVTSPMAIDCLSRSPSGALEFGTYESGWSEWGVADGSTAMDVAHSAQQEILRSLADTEAEQFDHKTTSVLRLSLMPDNLLTKPWKSVIEAFQPALEEAMLNNTGGELGDMLEHRENAIRAVVFRRRCLRAIADASMYPLKQGMAGQRNAALVTWIAHREGRCICFARKFVADTRVEPETVVMDYERLLRTKLGGHNRYPSVCHDLNAFVVQKNTRVTKVGLRDVHFLDDASRQTVNGPGTRLIEYCSANAVLAVSSCAVSVVHWPVV